jgi:Phosphotransferase enzyme family
LKWHSAHGRVSAETLCARFHNSLPGHGAYLPQLAGKKIKYGDMRSLMDTHRAARAIGVAALGRDPGPMATVESSSHCVYVSPDVVVKIIDADRHSRLDREIALAPHLPAGLTAPLLGSGIYRLGTRDVRYACYARLPGTAPGMGMPGVDGVTARLLAEDAVQRLDRLHHWIPAGHAEQTLREPLDHGGFISQAALLAEVEDLAAADRDGVVGRLLLDGLTAIAERAPVAARAVVPVHADCHWGNWLACDQRVTALLDFEWARFGEPVDDWFFLVRFSGPHKETVLDIIACATTISREILRAQCEVRDATYLASDLRIALAHPEASAGMRAERLRALDELIVERYWWRHR